MEQATLPTLGWPALIPGPVFLAFEIPGKPGHKARHRSRVVVPRFGKPFVHQYADPDTAAYEKMIAEYACLLMRNKPPTERPVCLVVHAFKPIPVSWTVTERARALAGNIMPVSKPDHDNFCKVASDAMNKIVYLDDSQVVDGRCIKLYSDSPALRIEVREFVEP